MAEFFHMGGYAFYVWSAYGIVVLVMVANVLMPLRKRRILMDNLKRRVRAKRRQAA